MLIIGGILLFFGISAAVYWLLVFGWFGIIPGLALTFGAAFGVGRLRGVFEDRCGISSQKFFLCAYMPSVAAAVIYFVIVICLINDGHMTAIQSSLNSTVFGFVWMITAAAAVISGTAIPAISAKLREKKAH